MPRRSVLGFFGSWFFCLALAAEDVVIVSSAADPAARIKKAGQILDYLGPELRLRTRLRAEEAIPAARIVEIQTAWTPPHETARTARAEGRWDDAIAAFREAKAAETRPWAARQVMSELAGCYLDAGRIENSVREFLAILAADQESRHWEVIPLAWRPAGDDPSLEARAAAWLSSRAEPAALLGASWLLPGSRRAAAIARLEELQKSADSRIAASAAIQLWRTKLVSATLDDGRRWQAQLERFPLETQAAGWYVLGEIYSRLDQPQRAALAWLKVPLVFRQQRAIAADALLAAGGQLEKMSRQREAAGLYGELVRDFPQLPAVAEAQARLARATGAGP
jgi:tetratricopeptide (TPR) repeat protein